MEIKGQGLCSQAWSDSESQQRALRRNASLPSEHDLGESCVHGGGGIGHQSRFREVECGARRGVSGFRSTWRGVMETRPGRAARSSVMEGAWLGHHGMRGSEVGTWLSAMFAASAVCGSREEADMTGLGAAQAEALQFIIICVCG